VIFVEENGCEPGGEDEGLDMRIAIEPEALGDSRTMFRVLIDEKIIAEGLTSAQAHLLVGDILERLALPKEPGDIQRSARPEATGRP
jgi:hypothetical protein